MKIRPLPAACAVAFASFCCNTPTLAADSGCDAVDTTCVSPVVVTATRTPVPRSRTLAPTLVIDRAEIARAQALDVAGILRQYAGIEIARTGGPGQPVSLFVRGANSNHVLVLLDGVRLNNGSTGTAALADIAPQMIERIEVVEGPRSALYGSDAIGGVVDIITRQPGAGRLEANIGGGAFGTVNGGAALRDQGRVDGHRWGLAVQTQQIRSGGYPTFQGATQDAPFRNSSFNGRATLDLDGVALEARGWDSQGRSSYLNTAYQNQPPYGFAGFTPADEDFHNQQLALSAATDLAARWRSSLTLSRSLDDVRQLQIADYVRTVRPEADWHNVVGVDAHNRLSFGLRAWRERVDALSYGTRIAIAKDTDYAYLEDEADYGAHHLGAALSYLHDGAFGERFNWNAQYGYDLTARTRLVALAGTGFHTPTASDRFGFGGNPNLQPEKALDYEVGVQQRLGRWQHLSLRAFHIDVRDLIQIQPAPGTPAGYLAVNVDRTRNEGLQLAWRYRHAGWSARLGGVWQNPRDLDTGARLLRRARTSASLQLARQWDRYDLGMSFYTSGRRQDIGAIDGAPTTDGGYGLLDLNAGARLTRRLRLDLRLDNALNHHYQTAAGYNQAGAALYANLRYALPL
jgi:Outer membrane cobalamin receptor protein